MRDLIDGKRNRQEHWGAQRVFNAPWTAGQRRTLLQKPPYRMPGAPGEGGYCVPQVQSMLLIASGMNSAISPNYAFRFSIHVGQGGARMSVILDALNTQQVSLAGENIGVDVFCEALDNTNPAGNPYIDPGVNPTFGVTLADGNVSSGQSTYTQGFTVLPLSQLNLPVPSMATGWRIDTLDGTATDALVAGLSYLIVGQTSQALYLGPSLKPLQYASGFLPLPGNAALIKVQNTTAIQVSGIIQWGLDL